MTTATETFPAQIVAFVFRSDVVGGDPDHIAALDGKIKKIDTGWARESGFHQLEVLKKPKYITSLEEKGYEFRLTQSGDIGAWLNGAPCSRLHEFNWRWMLDERLFLTACFWDELNDNG